jgi:hypothetical protein
MVRATMIHSTRTRRFEDWQEIVRPIGHSEYPFLDAHYSPTSRGPCRGFVEWIADAWLEGDFPAIVALLTEIIRANPGVGVGVDAFKEKIERKLASLLSVEMHSTIGGLDRPAFINLLSAYLLQDTIDGYQEEFVIIRPGRKLMVASILPWDFDFFHAHEAVEHINQFISRMRRETRGLSDFWKEVQFYGIEVTERFNQQKLDSIDSLRKRLTPLSISARMHFLDILRYCRNGVPHRRLEDCTFYETRSVGCYAHETGQEIRNLGLVTTDIPVELMGKWFKKAALQRELSRQEINYRKTANRQELFALISSRAPHQLRELVLGEGGFWLENDLVDSMQVLLEYCEYQEVRIGIWVGGSLIPALRAYT